MCFGIMGRCLRNVNDWLRVLVIVILYNFVYGVVSFIGIFIYCFKDIDNLF